MAAFFILKQIIEVENLKQTAYLANKLVTHLKPGQIIALEGDLGAGKTAFVRFLVDALGGDINQVSSPTFALLHIYEGSLEIYHFDVYRFSDSNEFIEAGFEEYLYANGISIIEWAPLIRDILPPETLWIHIALNEGYDSTARTFTIEGLANKII